MELRRVALEFTAYTGHDAAKAKLEKSNTRNAMRNRVVANFVQDSSASTEKLWRVRRMPRPKQQMTSGAATLPFTTLAVAKYS